MLNKNFGSETKILYNQIKVKPCTTKKNRLLIFLFFIIVLKSNIKFYLK